MESTFEKVYSYLDYAASCARGKGRSIVEEEDINESLKPYLHTLDSIDKENRYVSAIHEAGHCAIYIAMRINVDATTIIPKEEVLGFCFSEENLYNINQNESYVKKWIAIYCGGWAAEKVFFVETSDNSSDDIERAITLAYDSIAYDIIENEFIKSSTILFLKKTELNMLTEEEKSAINKKVEEIINEGKNRAREIILEHMEFVKKLAEALMENLFLSSEQIQELVDQYYYN